MPNLYTAEHMNTQYFAENNTQSSGKVDDYCRKHKYQSSTSPKSKANKRYSPYKEGKRKRRQDTTTNSNEWLPLHFPIHFSGFSFLKLHLFPSEPLILTGLHSKALYACIDTNIVIQTESEINIQEKDSWEIYSKTNKRGVKETDTSILAYKIDPTANINKEFNQRDFTIGLGYDRWYRFEEPVLKACMIDWCSSYANARYVGITSGDKASPTPTKVIGAESKELEVSSWLNRRCNDKGKGRLGFHTEYIVKKLDEVQPKPFRFYSTNKDEFAQAKPTKETQTLTQLNILPTKANKQTQTTSIRTPEDSISFSSALDIEEGELSDKENKITETIKIGEDVITLINFKFFAPNTTTWTEEDDYKCGLDPESTHTDSDYKENFSDYFESAQTDSDHYEAFSDYFDPDQECENWVNESLFEEALKEEGIIDTHNDIESGQSNTTDKDSNINSGTIKSQIEENKKESLETIKEEKTLAQELDEIQEDIIRTEAFYKAYTKSEEFIKEQQINKLKQLTAFCESCTFVEDLVKQLKNFTGLTEFDDFTEPGYSETEGYYNQFAFIKEDHRQHYSLADIHRAVYQVCSQRGTLITPNTTDTSPHTTPEQQATAAAVRNHTF